MKKCLSFAPYQMLSSIMHYGKKQTFILIRHHLSLYTKQFHLPLFFVDSVVCGHSFGKVQNQFRIQYFSPFVIIKNWEFWKYFTQTIQHEAVYWWIKVWRSMIRIGSIKKMKGKISTESERNFHRLGKFFLKVFISYFSLIF